MCFISDTFYQNIIAVIVPKIHNFLSVPTPLLVKIQLPSLSFQSLYSYMIMVDCVKNLYEEHISVESFMAIQNIEK
jgi:hypothetical protein